MRCQWIVRSLAMHVAAAIVISITIPVLSSSLRDGTPSIMGPGPRVYSYLDSRLDRYWMSSKQDLLSVVVVFLESATTNRRPYFSSEVTEAEVPYWVRDLADGQLEFDQNGNPILTLRVTASGWPFRSMRYFEHRSSRGDRLLQIYSGLELEERGPNSAEWKPAVPYGVIGAGMLANVVLLAGMMFVATWSFRTIRIAIRRRRGRCVQCGYSLDGLGETRSCPECGKEIAGR